MKDNVVNKTVFRLIEELAPLDLAYDWDNVGLQIGSYEKQVKKVMVTLDVLESVVDEAIEKGVDLIIAHHPLMFKPLKTISVDQGKGRIIKKLIKHDITVYAVHTNLDVATGGVNDTLSELLGLHTVTNLMDTQTEKLLKLAVYVPKTHANELIDALDESGAGHIGNYSHCSFRIEGKGAFKPLAGSTPFLGKVNKTEVVEEVKIETIIKEKDLSGILNVVTEVHPYEEVAYDIFTLLNKGKVEGIGRVGLLNESMSLKNFADHVKKKFDLSHVRVTGNLDREIEKVAILGGSGEKFIKEAMQSGAEVYITGDMTFHIAQEAMELGLAVIDAGHYIEKVMKKATKDYLEKQFSPEELIVILSETDTDPFQFL